MVVGIGWMSDWNINIWIRVGKESKKKKTRIGFGCVCSDQWICITAIWIRVGWGQWVDGRRPHDKQGGSSIKKSLLLRSKLILNISSWTGRWRVSFSLSVVVLRLTCLPIPTAAFFKKIFLIQFSWNPRQIFPPFFASYNPLI